MENEYYEEIIHDEWSSLVDKRIQIDDRMFNNIKSFIKSIDSLMPMNVSIEQQNKRIQLVSGYILNTDSISDMGIDICPDEWFLVHTNYNNHYGRYYFHKCDQIDGLFEFLKDNIK